MILTSHFPQKSGIMIAGPYFGIGLSGKAIFASSRLRSVYEPPTGQLVLHSQYHWSITNLFGRIGRCLGVDWNEP